MTHANRLKCFSLILASLPPARKGLVGKLQRHPFPFWILPKRSFRILSQYNTCLAVCWCHRFCELCHKFDLQAGEITNGTICTSWNPLCSRPPVLGRWFSAGDTLLPLQPNVDNVGLIRNTVLEAAMLTGDIVNGHRMRWRAVERFGVVLFNKTTSQIGYQHPGRQTTLGRFTYHHFLDKDLSSSKRNHQQIPPPSMRRCACLCKAIFWWQGGWVFPWLDWGSLKTWEGWIGI